MLVRVLFLVFSLALQGVAAAEPVVRLTTHDLPPYGSYIGPERRFDGIAVRVVACAMRQIGRPYELAVVPWARAQKMVETGAADGFFAASQNVQREGFAVMSAIVAEQEWRWYLRSDSPMNPAEPAFRQQARVGSFIGGNMLDWLNSNGYKVDATPANTEQLLKMLMAGRIDAILANNLVMGELARKHDLQGRLRSVLQENKPLGVYFSKRFLETAPGFLAEFDRAVPGCRKQQTQS